MLNLRVIWRPVNDMAESFVHFCWLSGIGLKCCSAGDPDMIKSRPTGGLVVCVSTFVSHHESHIFGCFKI